MGTCLSTDYEITISSSQLCYSILYKNKQFLIKGQMAITIKGCNVNILIYHSSALIILIRKLIFFSNVNYKHFSNY